MKRSAFCTIGFLLLLVLPSAAQAQLRVTDLAPRAAVPGASIFIYGTGFSEIAEENVVTFGGQAAVVTAATEKRLTVTVPEGGPGSTAVGVTAGDNSTTSPYAFGRLTWANTASFPQDENLATGLDGPTHVSLADLNGNGALDLLVALPDANQVRWYRNLGLGSISTARTIDAASGGATRLVVADLDGDGMLDIIAAAPDDNALVWYRQVVAGTFVEATLADNLNGLDALDAADLDGDGDIDLVTAASFDQTLTWFTNDGTGTFTSNPPLLAQLQRVTDLRLADADGDGDFDIVFAEFDANRIGLLRNNGSATFGPDETLTERHNAGVVEPYDLERDGDLDFFVIRPAGREVLWVEQLASSFATAEVVAEQVQGTIAAVAGDLRANDQPNMVHTHSNGLDWYGYGGGEFIFLETLPTSTPQSIAAADFDADGDLDLIYGANGRVGWYANTAIGTAREGAAALPAAYVLQQNYPNPFNPTTHIRYAVPQQEPVQIILFDVLGRPVRTLVEATQPAGWHTAVLDATGLSNGVYFYRMTAGAFTTTRALLLQQ